RSRRAPRRARRAGGPGRARRGRRTVRATGRPVPAERGGIGAGGGDARAARRLRAGEEGGGRDRQRGAHASGRQARPAPARSRPPGPVGGHPPAGPGLTSVQTGRGPGRASFTALAVALVSVVALGGCVWIKQASHAVGTAADGDAPSTNPVLDLAGNYVVFQSDATNLVPGDTNGVTDVFVRNMTTKVTSLVSVASGGGPTDGASTHPSISSDSRFIAFEST